MSYKRLALVFLSGICALYMNAEVSLKERIVSSISIKKPGNDAVEYYLKQSDLINQPYDLQLVSDKKLPVVIYQDINNKKTADELSIHILATEDVYFNFSQKIITDFSHDDCLFYMPGFWYRKNLRSPEKAPSFNVSDSWVVREDRLSSPATSIYDEKKREFVTVLRSLDGVCGMDALTTHQYGDVILSGETSLGYIGFENYNNKSALSFGFPYKEAPYSYKRKLTLAPYVRSFQFLPKGKMIDLKWVVYKGEADDYADCIKQNWEYCYDIYSPKPVDEVYSNSTMKSVLSNFFSESFVENKTTDYFSGVHLYTEDCKNQGIAEVGFVGRTLLNAFNALEYGEKVNRVELIDKANKVFDSYLVNGFSAKGFFNEVRDFKNNTIEDVHSIRRQSEGVYAILYYLKYEKERGRIHKDWEKRVKMLLDYILELQNHDGSFPRKFKDDMSIVDKSGGSTPSATLPLVMAYKYFKDKKYLAAAKRSVDYLDKEIISKSDYFSSTLDANCEDKEASLYASTAAYYLSLVTKGREQQYYSDLSLKAAYFALSWYYTWDVPFAKGQMLGDIGLKTRGWGNVSVENNHIDVFVFGFVDVLNWLANKYDEKRFSSFANVINTSMRQLLPYKNSMCGIAKEGFYPEVVQHTNWDYGKNGKGFYNNIFAPGWVVASLWEMLSPGRAEWFVLDK